MKTKSKTLTDVASTLKRGTVPHRRFKEAADRLVRLIRFPTDIKVVLAQ